MKPSLIISLLILHTTVAYVHADELCVYGICINDDISEQCKADIARDVDDDGYANRLIANNYRFETIYNLFEIREATIKDNATNSLRVIDQLIYEGLLSVMRLDDTNPVIYLSIAPKIETINKALKSHPLQVDEQHREELKDLYLKWKERNCILDGKTMVSDTCTTSFQ